jgi:DnaK suppressor protein
MDEVDMTVERYEQELLLNMQCRAEKLVQEIRDALRRIRDGSFGICQECGRDIEIQRLKVQPMATLCLECKKEMESIQRRKVA